MPFPTPEFGDGTQWDGTTLHSRPTVDVYKGPDGEIGNRHTAEILALEEALKNVLTTLEVLKSPGAANSILGVLDDQSDLEYKVLVEGNGITIAYAAGQITISAAAGGVAFGREAGENISVGDFVYMFLDGKVYKSLADAAFSATVIGCCYEAANVGEIAGIKPIGEVTKIGWGLTLGGVYYLSDIVAGGITLIPPTTLGHFVSPIGVAMNTNKLAVGIGLRVQL